MADRVTESLADATLGQLMAQVFKRYRGFMHDTLDELGLYRGQAFIMGVLWQEEGLTQSELAERTHVQPATMTTTLQRMESAGLVERRSDPDDQRLSRVYLTEEGHTFKEPVTRLWQAVEDRTFRGFSMEERVLMRRFLFHIIANLDEPV
jgi:DNA-binding MarR family transcriptional regulator